MRLASALIFMAAVLLAQPGANPEDLYKRVRPRVLQDITRMPDFTCVQTINRRVYSTSAPNRGPPRCEEIVRDHNTGKHTPPLVSWERLRVGVAIADKHEVFSWVAAAKFEQNDLAELVGGGLTEVGDFGSFLRSVFGDHTSMTFRRIHTLSGRRLLEYSYETPRESSGFKVRVGSESYTTAYDGSVCRWSTRRVRTLCSISFRTNTVPQLRRCMTLSSRGILVALRRSFSVS
jgi:hypothetical protein